ncbi:leucine-rich repeat domain-containing protein, partial [Candidatus Berkelbacteria bacterium]|nr:leucine-rich repeat domain-containing protein [Candidatus Berkelbacteria bacterium]
KLQWLSLSNTQIKDLPDLAQLTNLQTLYLGNTPLANDAQAISELERKYPKVNIDA